MIHLGSLSKVEIYLRTRLLSRCLMGNILWKTVGFAAVFGQKFKQPYQICNAGVKSPIFYRLYRLNFKALHSQLLIFLNELKRKRALHFVCWDAAKSCFFWDSSSDFCLASKRSWAHWSEASCVGKEDESGCVARYALLYVNAVYGFQMKCVPTILLCFG